tara:strand:- start:2221 stop:3192 length:972 start_codon:yes stop_codon:yes gene_type:complete
MSEKIKRENELSALINRNLMERLPPNTNKKEWDKFRSDYNNAQKLNVNTNPAQLDIELNSTCNLKCSFCIQSVRDQGKYILNFECFKKLIDEAIENGTKSLKLNYQNEPLIIQDLERYIEYAKDKGMVNIFFSTNGIMLNEKRSRSLINSGLTKIFISIDAINSETYFKQRNSKHYNRVVNNILKFIEIRNSLNLSYPLVRVNFLKTTLNINQEKQFIKFWKGKADIIIIQEMNEVIDNKSDLFIKNDKSNYKCSYPFKQLVVDAQGRILPCCCMNGVELQIGSIKEMSLKEAWNSKKMRDLRDLHKKGDYKSNPICKRCIEG